MEETYAAWDRVHEALPKGWHVAEPSFDPAAQLWEVVAPSPKPGGRGRAPEYVIGIGGDVHAALVDLAAKLEARRSDTRFDTRSNTRSPPDNAEPRRTGADN